MILFRRMKTEFFFLDWKMLYENEKIFTLYKSEIDKIMFIAIASTLFFFILIGKWVTITQVIVTYLPPQMHTKPYMLLLPSSLLFQELMHCILPKFISMSVKGQCLQMASRSLKCQTVGHIWHPYIPTASHKRKGEYHDDDLY